MIAVTGAAPGPLRVGIADPSAPISYDFRSLGEPGVGGTEATILRIVRALGETCRFTIFQACRSSRTISETTVFAPLEEIYFTRNLPVLLVINSWKLACKLRKAHPGARILLWLHVYPGRHNRRMGEALARAGVMVICVSRTHMEAVRALAGPGPQLTWIYNPVPDGILPGQDRRDPGRLLFASSPHKGLEEVLEVFTGLRRVLPALRLEIADPGYLRYKLPELPAGARYLGSLPHSALLQRMRGSLCLFQPQRRFAETFGLVIAEANATGTPVIVRQGVGANDEVVSSREQVVDHSDSGKLADLIRQWQKCYPLITPKSDFRMSKVGKNWTRLIIERAR